MIYQFYYIHPKKNKKCIIGIRDCKYPKRTKIYKQLLNSLDMGFVEVIGCEPHKEI